jgi:hypothetical protein
MFTHNNTNNIWLVVVLASALTVAATEAQSAVVAAGVGAIGDPNLSGGSIHIHGTGIDAISHSGRDVTALYASAAGEIHANQASYSLKTTGQKTRIYNVGGHVHAPYHWEEHANAPSIVSVTGADIAVITADGLHAC